MEEKDCFVEGLISVIVPVYNVQEHLRKCVESLVKQTYSPVEIILVDDGSTDDSPVLCDQFAEMYDNIFVFHRNNSGPSAARNFGIGKAKGEFLAFCDSDDWMEDNALETMHAPMVRYNLDLTMGAYARFEDGNDYDSSMHRITKHPLVIFSNKQELASLFSSPATSLAGVSAWAKLYRTCIIRENSIQFPEDVNYEEDCCFNLQYYRHIRDAGAVHACVYHYRQQITSLSKGYRSSAFPMLVNGFNRRRDFMTEIGMDSLMQSLNVVFLLVIMNILKRIEIAKLSRSEKREEFRKLLLTPETLMVANACPKSPKKLTNWVLNAIRRQSLDRLDITMRLWHLKKALQRKKQQIIWAIRKHFK